MSDWLALVLIIAATCAIVVVIATLRQRRAGEHDDPSETPDVIEYMTMMLGVVYAIVLGLAIAGVWESRSGAEEWVRQEAQALHEISERAGDLPGAGRGEIRQAVDTYVGYVVQDEWPSMQENGELTDRGDELLGRVREAVGQQEPSTVRQTDAYQAMTEQVAAADEARVGRGQSAGPTMPPVVWVALITGAFVVICMLFFLQIQRSRREMILAGVFCALIAFLLFLIWDFDDPYRSISNATTPYTDLFPQAADAS